MKNSVRLALCALVCLILGGASVNAQTISTVVGGGPVGISATGSSVGGPVAVRFDAAGNMYVLDNKFSRVLKVDIATNTMSVYAGDGTNGFAGDGGPAINAQMNQPSGMCIDPATGNLFIADSDNNVIREVTAADGIMHTFAGVPTNSGSFGGDGGAILAAHFHFPDGCAFDSKGNMYIADRANNEVRVIIAALGGTAVPPFGITGAAGTIQNFAGIGGAGPASPASGYQTDGMLAKGGGVYGPFDVVVDSHDNVYFVDLGNNFDVNNNPDPTGSGLPNNNNVVREVLAVDGTVHTVAGVQGTYSANPPAPVGVALSTPLNQPKGLSVDLAGNLYFCDSADQAVLKLSGGNLVVVAGTLGHRGFAGDGHPATSANLSFPAGTTIDGNGNLFIGDVDSNAVRIVPLSANYTVSTPNILLNNIGTLAGNGRSSYGGDGSTAIDAELNSPTGLAVDGSGNLAIADTGSDLIRYVTAGKISTIAGGPENNGFGVSPSVINQAIGVATDAAGNVYFADTANCLVRKISSAGGGVTTIAGVVPTAAPVCGFVTQGGAAVGTTLGTVNGIAVDSKGNVFFSDSTNNVIWEVPAVTAGNFVANNAYIVVGTQSTTGAFGGDGSPATQAQLNVPMGIYIDIFNNLFIADAANHRVREVPALNVGTMTAGSIYTIAGTGTQGITGDTGAATNAEIQFPYAIVVDHNESVFFTDTTFSLDAAVPAPHAASSQTVRQIAGPNVTGKTVGHIYTVAGNTNLGGFAGDGASAIAAGARLNFPTGVALIPTGPAPSTTANLLISDSINNRVRSVLNAANVAPVALVTLSPNPATFPTAEPVGTASAPLAITVTNSGGAPLTVNTSTGLTIGGADAGDFSLGTNTCTAALAPAATCTINVIFTPTVIGTRNATLSVASTAFGVPQVALQGVGGTPTATLNPTSLTFASTTVGTAAPTQTVTLSNTGNAATIVTGITFSGANAADYTETDTCVGAVGGIAPTTGTCTITVTFKPGAVGASTATMTVASNVAGAANTVALSGTGAPATLTLTVKDTDASSTQTVTAGSTATYNLSVSGNQSVTATITCTGAPTAATCTPTPASVAVTAAAAGTFKVSVTTTARGEMLPFNQPSTKMQPPSFMQLAPMASIALLFIVAMLFGWMQNQTGRARTLRVALSLALILMPIAAATVLVGCGGGSSTTTPPPVTGTPAGSYTLTVTATSGSTTASTTVTLVVN